MFNKQAVFSTLAWMMEIEHISCDQWHRYADALPASLGPPRSMKVKVTLEQAKKAQRGSRGIAVLFH